MPRSGRAQRLSDGGDSDGSQRPGRSAMTRDHRPVECACRQGSPPWPDLLQRYRRQKQPAVYDRGSRRDGSRSDGQCLLKHLGPKLGGQIAGRQQINADAEQGLQFSMQSPQIKQRGARQGIDQKINVAILPISTLSHRSKNSQIGCTKTADRRKSGGSIFLQYQRGAHGRLLGGSCR